MAFSLVMSPNVLIDGTPSGSGCCVWFDGLSRTYVLSAAHVVDGVGTGTPVQWVAVDGDLGAGVTLEPHMNWMPVAGGQLDAGLIHIDDAGPFGIGGLYPWAEEIATWDSIDTVRSVVICGKYGQIFATFDRKLHEGEVFGDPVPRPHGRLLRFRYDAGTTARGDSGAPIIALPEGTLVGMHIALDSGPGVDYAIGVAAEDIRAAFDGELPGFTLRP